MTDVIAELHARRVDMQLRVEHHASLPSTMDAAARAAEDGAPHGHVVVADAQSAGRGRRGHAWSSPPEAGLYLSFLARPTRDHGLVTLAAGDAVRHGIARATGLAAEMKWPNDVLLGRRKLAGILAEGIRIGSPDAAVIIGVGINVRVADYPPDVARRATSIEAELGRSVDRGVVLAAVLEALWDRLALLDRGGAEEILHAWRAASPGASGAQVEWDGPRGPRVGVTAGIDSTGALLIRTANGTERIVGGEVRWR